MSNGIYIVANDAYYDEAVACINSIRFYDKLIPIICIPYDDYFDNIRIFCRNKNACHVQSSASYVKDRIYVPFVLKDSTWSKLRTMGQEDAFPAMKNAKLAPLDQSNV